MPDIAGNSSTTATLGVGGSVSGSLETIGDHDWYRINLTAGQAITVTLNSLSLEDPYLKIFDSSGNLLYENDDGGEGLNSKVSFTASYSGVYYIDAGSWEDGESGGYIGDYQVNVTNYAPPPVWTIEQVAQQLTNGYWGGQSHHFYVAPGGSLSVNITALTAAGQNLAREALSLWTDVIGVNFNYVTVGGQILFDDEEEGAHAQAQWSGGITSSAQVNVSVQWLTNYGVGLNSYAFQTYVHEIGHALGLGHAGDYNGSAEYQSDGLYQNDGWPMTVMSYFSQQESTYFASQGFTHQYVLTPMIADIVAMSSLYGLSTTTRTGDTTYGFNSNAGRAVFDASTFARAAYTVIDSGGVDTLDYSGYAASQRINLNAETYSNVGGLTGNVSIARGTIIENAVGGSGNDVLIGNGANNVLSGGGGSDNLTGGGGVDTFRGTAAQLNGDTIIDFTSADRIAITDANPNGFVFALNGNVLTYSGGSLTLTGFTGQLKMTAAAGGGIQLAAGQAQDALNDFNGDGRSDILWRHDNGAIFNFLGTANGGVVNNGGVYTVVDTIWDVAGTGDFNGDGRDDILWRQDNGAIFNLLGTANGGFANNGGNSYLGLNATWTVAGIGDFNGDQRDDILWRDANGVIFDYLGTASGGFVDNSNNLFTDVGDEWHAAGIGDFNGDGKDDILWRNDNGAIFNFLGTASGGVVNNGDNIYTVVDNVWHVAGIGDFNGDGRDDILWRNDNGAVFNFLGTTNGGVQNNGDNSYTAMSLAWSIEAIGDYNGDGSDDILWRDASGTIIDWLGTANGSFVDNSNNLTTNVGTQWHVEPQNWLFA